MFPSHSRARPLFSGLEEPACNFCHLHPLIDPHSRPVTAPHSEQWHIASLRLLLLVKFKNKKKKGKGEVYNKERNK